MALVGFKVENRDDCLVTSTVWTLETSCIIEANVIFDQIQIALTINNKLGNNIQIKSCIYLIYHSLYVVVESNEIIALCRQSGNVTEIKAVSVIVQ